MKRIEVWAITIVIASFALTSAVWAQTSQFSYQGKLNESGTPANGSFQMQFKLFDSLGGASQIGSTISDVPVTVSEGIFNVKLDFGASSLPGANRFLEIAIRHNSGESYVTLSPREQIVSSPYSVRTLSAASADNAANLGGVAANQYLQVNGDGSGLTNLNGANIIPNTVTSSALAPDTFPNTRNISLLGSLRWDLLTQRVSVGVGPQSVAFDGANIWAANELSDSVTKIRVSDSSVLGTYPVGDGPIAIVSDGTNIWTANFNSNNITKLRASDGACVGTCTFAVPAGPAGIAFDGANVWVASFSANMVTKVRASDGLVLGSFSSMGNGARAVAFDGANIWVTNFQGSNVVKLRASDGACDAPCSFNVGSGPAGLAFDGANMWVTNWNSASVTKLRSKDGACVGTCTFNINTVGTAPLGVVFDGENIWVSTANGQDLTKLRATDGAYLGTYPVGTNAWGVAFDGANIWVALYNAAAVRKVPAFK